MTIIHKVVFDDNGKIIELCPENHKLEVTVNKKKYIIYCYDGKNMVYPVRPKPVKKEKK